MIVMRGHVERNDKGEIVSGGTLVFYFDDDGHALGLDLYRDWKMVDGFEMEPGKEYR